MNVEEIREFCLAMAETTESFPFGDTTLVFKVSGKIFALVNLEGELSINLKCDPELALNLREHYDAVLPGYHMNKKYWNTIVVARVKREELENWIVHSYDQVVEKLPLRDRKGRKGKKE